MFLYTEKENPLHIKPRNIYGSSIFPPILVTSPRKYVPNRAETRDVGPHFGCRCVCCISTHQPCRTSMRSIFCGKPGSATGEPLFMCSPHLTLTFTNLRKRRRWRRKRRRQPRAHSPRALHLRPSGLQLDRVGGPQLAWTVCSEFVRLQEKEFLYVHVLKQDDRCSEPAPEACSARAAEKPFPKTKTTFPWKKLCRARPT